MSHVVHGSNMYKMHLSDVSEWMSFVGVVNSSGHAAIATILINWGFREPGMANLN
jgi:hypothetical protein